SQRSEPRRGCALRWPFCSARGCSRTQGAMTPSEPPSEPPAELWAAPRRTHPASPWLSLVAPRGPGGLVLFLLLLGNRWAAAAIGAIGVVGALLTWWRRTWSFDGSMLTLDDGVFRRTYRRVPVGRVQQVEVHEPFVHRL